MSDSYDYRIVLQETRGRRVVLAPQGNLDAAHKRLRMILDGSDEGVYWNGWVERRADCWETFEAARVPRRSEASK